ncbi:MAG: hypothetical protein LQ342_002543 [Letrouitia transgressa]|nr:MAG: hypothetical protein LQ342_002543 [Letrouitia transgressa]
MFWKSLDHQGINAKSADKRQFQPKVLHTEIQIKYEEQRRMATAPWNGLSKSQFTYYFDDKDVIHDACHLILTFLYNQDKANEDDKKRVEKFIVRFIPTFFGLDQDSLQARMTGIHDADSPNEEFEEESVSEEPNINRTRRTANGKRGNLLRGVLERKTGKDEAGRESKESTPDISSMDEDAANSNDTSNEFSRIDDPADQRWMDYPIAGPIDPRTPYQRDAYNLYGSVNVYCFFRMFQTLYERLVNVKVNEKQVHEDVARSNQPKTAHELNLTDKIPSDFFKDTSPKASYYRQVVNMCEDVMKQRIEIVHFEETLRRFYMMKGWQLYNYERMISAITRFALNILVSDKSDKSLDIINLFYTDRAKDETTHDAEIHYRKQVDKLAPKDTDIFRITWEPKHSRSTISIFKKDDPTFDVDMMEAATRWSYYISSYALRDPTEGITADKLRFPFFRRNVPKPTTSEEEYNSTYVPLLNEDGLIMRIKPETYEICFRDPGTSDWFLHDVSVERLGMEKMEEVKKNRRQKFEEKWGANGYFTKTLTKAEANAVNEKFEKWVNEGPTGEREEGARDSGEIGRYQADDETMTGT